MEQDKTPEKQLNEVETGNLPEKEFRIMIVKMKKKFTTRLETQKTPNIRSLRKKMELEESDSLTSDYSTKLQ